MLLAICIVCFFLIPHVFCIVCYISAVVTYRVDKTWYLIVRRLWVSGPANNDYMVSGESRLQVLLPDIMPQPCCYTPCMFKGVGLPSPELDVLAGCIPGRSKYVRAVAVVKHRFLRDVVSSHCTSSARSQCLVEKCAKPEKGDHLGCDRPVGLMVRWSEIRKPPRTQHGGTEVPPYHDSINCDRYRASRSRRARRDYAGCATARCDAL